MNLSFGDWFVFNEISDRTAEKAEDKLNSKLPFDNLFPNGITRIAFPFHDIGDKHEELENQLIDLDQGFVRVDWKTGDAIKRVNPGPGAPPGTKPKEVRIKLGKAISYLPAEDQIEWKNWWSENNSSNYMCVVSRNPYDVVRMSDHKGIESCHSPGSSHWAHCLLEMKFGGLVAYVVKKDKLDSIPKEQFQGNDEIFKDSKRDVDGIKPVARLRIRRFTHKKEGYDLAIPEDHVYGNDVGGFEDQVRDWARDAQRDIIKDKRPNLNDFTLRGGGYRDSNDGSLFNDFFGDNEDSYSSNTTHGVAGKEDGENTSERDIRQMDDMEAKYNREFQHVEVSQSVMDNDHYDDDEDSDGATNFDWSASMRVAIDSDRFTNKEIDQRTVWSSGTRWEGKKKIIGDSLTDMLKEASIYADEVDVDKRYKSLVNVNFSMFDHDRDDYSISGFETFCDYLKEEWEEKYDEIRRVILKWMIHHGYMIEGAIRKAAGNLKPDQFRNFTWEHENGMFVATMTPTPIGASQHIPYQNYTKKVEGDFLGHLNATIKNQIDQQLTGIIRAANQQLKLPGFDQGWIHSGNFSFSTDNFRVWAQSAGAYQANKINLHMEFRMDDGEDDQTVKIGMQLLHSVDRVLPVIIKNAAAAVQYFHDQAEAAAKQQVTQPRP